MRPRSLLVRAGAALALVACAFVPASAQQRFGTVTTVQLPKGMSAQAAALGDVNGDGRDDLVIASRRRAVRTLRVHYRTAGEAAFRGEPDAVLDLFDDVVAWGLADVHADAGHEVVLFTVRGVYALRPRASEEERYTRLLETNFLWQLPNLHDTFVADATFRDLDGDGLTDLVVPEPGAWRVALQRRGADGAVDFARSVLLRVPDAGGAGETEPAGARKIRGKSVRTQLRVSLTRGDVAADETGDLLSVVESVPAPILLDWDADGDLDVLGQTAEELHVWVQGPRGAFSEAPTASYPLPFVADRRRRLDVSYGAHAADLNRDGRADCVLFAADPASEEVRTQVLVYVQGAGRGAGAQTPAAPLFGPKGLPQQLLVVGGFAGAARLDDVDGDGRPDLVLGSARVDALDTVRAAASGTVDAELYVYLNRGERFSPTPDVRVGVKIPAAGLRRARSEIAARFVGDVTGDGVRELLLREDPERLRVLLSRRTREGLAVADRPLWEMRVDADAELHVHQPARGPAELLLVEDAQVLHVRFP